MHIYFMGAPKRVPAKKPVNKPVQTPAISPIPDTPQPEITPPALGSRQPSQRPECPVQPAEGVKACFT
jgi:hypothetical protein